jgi:hypothetical protein
MEKKEQEMIDVYEEILKTAKKGLLTVPPPVSFRYHRVHGELEKIKGFAQKKLVALTTKIRDNLKPHQIYVLNEYKPCIIPPVEKGRVGQADSPEGFVHILERVRAIPQIRYENKKEEIVQKAINKAKAPPGFILDEKKLKLELLKTMDRVRKLSDVEFAIKKEQIAQNIKEHFIPAKSPANIGVKIEKFLLQPETISLIEERLLN